MVHGMAIEPRHFLHLGNVESDSSCLVAYTVFGSSDEVWLLGAVSGREVDIFLRVTEAAVHRRRCPSAQAGAVGCVEFHHQFPVSLSIIEAVSPFVEKAQVGGIV